MTPRLVTGVSLVFVVTGAVLCLIVARHGIRRWAFMRNSAVADGVVVALREDRDGMDTVRVRFPRVRFRTGSGRDVTFEAGMGRGGAAWHVGDSARVRYQVDHPETAEVDSVAALWGPTVALALLALVFLSVGLSAWLGYIPG